LRIEESDIKNRKVILYNKKVIENDLKENSELAANDDNTVLINISDANLSHTNGSPNDNKLDLSSSNNSKNWNEIKFRDSNSEFGNPKDPLNENLSLLKHVVKIDSLRALFLIKKEMEDYLLEKKIELPNNEANGKFYEILKINLFNDLFDGLLNKHYHSFFKSLALNDDFKIKRENLLLQLYKENNQINSNAFVKLELLGNLLLEDGMTSSLPMGEIKKQIKNVENEFDIAKKKKFTNSNSIV